MAVTFWIETRESITDASSQLFLLKEAMNDLSPFHSQQYLKAQLYGS
jgi:hypothetical protein